MLSLLSLDPLLAAQGSPASPFTLHVYEDLVQVPTLAMTDQHDSYPGLSSAQFFVQLDRGPTFHPRHVRLQGLDAVSFAILLDVSDPDSSALANAFPAALSQQLSGLFQSNDTLSVYAMDCALVRSVKNLPATTPLLQSGITDALASPKLHGAGSNPRCGGARRLWDTIATVNQSFAGAPGRRILVVVSDGADQKSDETWESVRHAATSLNVTVFAIRPPLKPGYVATLEHDLLFSFHPEDVFSLLCGESGGIDLYSSPSTVGPTFKHLVDLLRNRYILEFARPANSTRGDHSIDVSIKDKHAIIRPSGATYPLPDKNVANDPNTLRSDPSRAPVFGTRKVLTLPQ